MACKYCGSGELVSKGSVEKEPFVECKSCGHRFIDNGKLPKMRTKTEVIVVSLNMYFEGLSVRKVARQLKVIYGIKVSHVTVWKWFMKYSDLVSEYVSTLNPELSGKYHEDETMINCEGEYKWFWQIIDEDTRFIVATHLSDRRNIKETIELFKKTVKNGKQRPKAMYFDGSHTYKRAFNKIFYSRYKSKRVQFIQNVGLNARKTNNLVERLHGTLKDRLKPMRGLKSEKKSKCLLNGFVVHYNFVRPHQSLGDKTPAEVAGLKGESGRWGRLIKKAYQHQNEKQLIM